MKELSIEEKAKRYDEVIEMANSLLIGDQLEDAWVYRLLPELKESEDEKMKDIIFDALSANESQERIEKHGINLIDCIEWLEKQEEQKSADKVEPKFKVGDWVINKHGFTMQIVDVRDSHYVYMYEEKKLSATIEQMENSCHLWTIQDAKDGDVLTCYSNIKGQPIEQTGIIKQYVGRHGGCSNSFKAYFGVDWDNNVVIEGYMGSSNIYPATKEQRDLLFQKMKEAGYEWDAEKKELKKIEKKLTWSEEDERILVSIMEDVMPCGECPDYPTDEEREYFYEGNRKVDWLKSLKERMQLV